MFENSMIHEDAIREPYVNNLKGRKIYWADRLRLRRQGASLNFPTHKMDRKIRACYPRGKAFLKMVDLHTAQWLSGDGRVRWN